MICILMCLFTLVYAGAPEANNAWALRAWSADNDIVLAWDADDSDRFRWYKMIVTRSVHGDTPGVHNAIWFTDDRYTTKVYLDDVLEGDIYLQSAVYREQDDPDEYIFNAYIQICAVDAYDKKK